MWHSTTHDLDPVKDELIKEVKSNKILLSGIINLSASHYIVDKQASRKSRALEISQALEVPFLYVNSLASTMRFSLMVTAFTAMEATFPKLELSPLNH